MSKQLIISLLVVLTFSLSHVIAYSADFNVGSTADSDCSDLHCDLQSALDEAGQNNQDDSITLEAGIYEPAQGSGAFVYAPAPSETFALHLIGAGMNETILDGTSAGVGIGILEVSDTSSRGNITISGMGFHNGIAADLYGLYIENGLDAVTIHACSFDNNAGGLKIVSSLLEEVIITDSDFRNNKSDNVGGLDVSGNRSVIIENSIFIENSSNVGGGVYVYADYIALSGNTFWQNTGGGAHVEQLTDITDGADIILTNNTFSHNSAKIEDAIVGGVLLRLFSDESEVDLFNNIIVNSTSPSGRPINDIYFDAAFADFNGDGKGGLLRLINNNYNKLLTRCFECSARKEEADNINSDPHFVDAENGDLHLQSSSPCINKGFSEALEMLAVDIDGDDRIIGEVPDIGADEFDGEIDGSGSASAGNSGAGGCSLIR